MFSTDNKVSVMTTDRESEFCELNDADLAAVVGGALNAALYTGSGIYPEPSQSCGPGAGKPTFNMF
jgi:bacteriocin-like protein